LITPTVNVNSFHILLLAFFLSRQKPVLAAIIGEQFFDEPGKRALVSTKKVSPKDTKDEKKEGGGLPIQPLGTDGAGGR
jgi:hypothetical protein